MISTIFDKIYCESESIEFHIAVELVLTPGADVAQVSYFEIYMEPRQGPFES